jgi:GT2 family glycosyltransferase
MEKFAIGIPTLNRADLLIPSLMKYVQDFNGVEIHIIDNGDQNLEEYEKYENIFVHTQYKNIGVAASWNILCDIIYAKHEWALIVNDDVYLGYGADTINQVIDDNNTFGLIQSHLNFSVILLNKIFYLFVGRFDEEFYPAYYEDSDYLYRMKLLGLFQGVDAKLNPKDARVSQTYEKSPEFVNDAMKYSRLRYIEKWGNIPLLETYKIPYNGENY